VAALPVKVGCVSPELKAVEFAVLPLAAPVLKAVLLSVFP
jgi:hypothetical protein